MKGQVQVFIDEKDSLLSEHQELMKRKAKLDLNIKDLQDELAGEVTSKVTINGAPPSATNVGPTLNQQ